MNRSQKRLLMDASSRLRRFGLSVRQILSGTIDEAAEKSQSERMEAEDLYRSAAGLRGGIAKIAQLRAYLQGASALGPEAQQVLGRLWDRAPAEQPQAIRQVIRTEFGQEPEALFREFVDEPLASASLGQVHQAVGQDGKLLAVKVQYPGVAEALADDLDSAGVLKDLVGGDLGEAVSAESLQGLRERLLSELDYRAEADNLRRFRRLFAFDPDVVIPDVVADRSTGKVLTMERIIGRSLPEVVRDGSDEQRSSAAQTILRFALECPIRLGVINVDPNPGNYLILNGNESGPGAKVGFLDFGCVAEIPEELQKADRALYWAMIKRDGEALRYAAHLEGLIPSAGAFDNSTYRRWEKLLSAPFLEREPVRLTPEYVKELGELTWLLVQGRKMALPPQTLLLWRQRLGILAVVSALRPALHFRELLAHVLEDGHPIPMLQRYP